VGEALKKKMKQLQYWGCFAKNMDEPLGTEKGLVPQMIINEIKPLKKRVAVLEFIIAFLFSICLTLIYAITNIFHLVYYSTTLYYGMFFLLVTFLSIQFVISLIGTVERVGVSLKKISAEWSKAGTVAKLGIILGIPSFLITVYQIINWLVHLILQVWSKS
jgi:hypothetical protein